MAKDYAYGIEEATPKPPPAWLKKQTAAELDAEEIRITYLVDKLLACVPTVIGGRFKTLKTLVSTDLVVSMSSGTSFLNRWKCTPIKVGIWSGESGKPALQNAQRRICASKGISTSDCQLDWHYTLPPLYDPKTIEMLIETIVREKYGAVFVDPAYLCLLDGGSAGLAGNVFSMGHKLSPLSQINQITGCLMGLVHHFGKWTASNQEYGPAELGELSQAGMAEWARQWLLLSRRSKYEMDGKHKLFLTAGGSLGQAYQLALDVDEGPMDKDGYFRTRWDVGVRNIAEAKEGDKGDKHADALRILKDRFLGCLLVDGDNVRKKICERVHVPLNDMSRWAFDELIADGKVVIRQAANKQNKMVEMLAIAT